MIEIQNYSHCCGCEACVQACPKQCIRLAETKEGFLYPHVNHDLCTDCKLCEKVCPYLGESETLLPLKVFAAKNNDTTIRMASSSGGVFTMLAEKIIDDGGVVFGARFDEVWEVVHDYTDKKEGIGAFRGSKYVQSRIGNSYKLTRKFLEDGRKVLFSGTSCQIAALNRFLRKEYKNLITVDVVCHGVPSPLVWRDYLHELTGHLGSTEKGNANLSSLKESPVISGISFRDKSGGWKNFGFAVWGVPTSVEDREDRNKEMTLLYESLTINKYLRCFVDNYTIRQSCYNCPAKGGKCKSDITLADMWGVWKHHPEFDNDRGVTAVLLNTQRALGLFSSLNCSCIEVPFDEFYEFNHSFNDSVSRPKFRNLFWRLYPKFHTQAINFVYMLRPGHIYCKVKSMLFK